MNPFQNESESVRIGDLTVENHVDRITLSGDVDLTLDKPGLALAKSLQTQVDAIVAAMTAAQDKGALPDKIENIAPVPVGNLFGCLTLRTAGDLAGTTQLIFMRPGPP